MTDLVADVDVQQGIDEERKDEGENVNENLHAVVGESQATFERAEPVGEIHPAEGFALHGDQLVQTEEERGDDDEEENQIDVPGLDELLHDVRLSEGDRTLHGENDHEPERGARQRLLKILKVFTDGVRIEQVEEQIEPRMPRGEEAGWTSSRQHSSQAFLTSLELLAVRLDDGHREKQRKDS